MNYYSARRGTYARFSRRLKVTVVTVLVPTVLTVACSPLRPSSMSNIDASSPIVTAMPQAAPALIGLEVAVEGESQVRAIATTEDGVTRMLTADVGPTGALESVLVDGQVVCVSDQCTSDKARPQVVQVIVAAVLLALALKAAWDFWNTCVTPARQESARTGTVKWSTVGTCYTQGAFILVGDGIGKYLEGKGVRGVQQVIENALRGAVPQDQLLNLFNTKNFSTSVGVVAEIAGRVVEAVCRAIYDLLRR